MPDPISFSRLRSTMRRVDEIGAIGGDTQEGPPPATIEMHVGRITSTTKTEGRFPGKRYDYDANADNADTPPAGAYTEKETIWIKARAGEMLSVGPNYDLKLVGTRASDGIDIYVIVSPPQMHRGKLDGTLSFGGSATMSIWAYSGSEADTTVNITVYDWALSSGQTVASGKQGAAFYDVASQRYYFLVTQCA